MTRLEISPLFGGDLFARFFPWISSQTEYAGRLSGFRPAGDLSYLVTVLAPLVLLCALGSPLARVAVRTQRPVLLGFALGAALQPLAALTGDCYEAASIILTRLARVGGVDWAFRLRGDDLAKVVKQAAAAPSPLAWVLFVGGCVGGLIIAIATLAACGGIAPHPACPASDEAAAPWTRRSVLRTGVGALLLGVSAWILKQIYVPRHLASAERHTLGVVVDVLVPTPEFPDAERVRLLERLLQDCEANRQTRRALIEGLQFLNARAREQGARDFASLDTNQREHLVEACARSAEGSVPQVFLRAVRDQAMQLVYSHPLTWTRVRFPHPPQPGGYLNYQQPPAA